MGDPYKGKVAGHVLIYGRKGTSLPFMRNPVSEKAICQCGAMSPALRTIQERIAWHQQHKADVLDTWVANGCDDRGHEVHL